MKYFKSLIIFIPIFLNLVGTADYFVGELYLTWRDGFDVVKLILKQAPHDINERQGSGHTALTEFSKFPENDHSLKIIKFLLGNGADPNLSYGSDNEYGESNADQMSKSLNGMITYNCTSGDTPLILAVKFGNIKVVKILLEFGANINSSNINNGRTPIQLAIISKPEIFELLLNAGAILDLTNSLVEKALNENPKIKQIIIKKKIYDYLNILTREISQCISEYT